MANEGAGRLKGLANRTLGDELTLKLAGYGLSFITGFAMAAGRIAGGAAPFGIAASVQAGTGIRGACSLAGACLGYFATGGIEWGVRYAAACVLAFTALFVTQDWRLSRRDWYLPAVVLIVTAISGLLARASAGADGPLLLAAECALSAGGAFFFREAVSGADRVTETSELRHTAAVAIFAAALLSSLSGVVLLHTVSIGRLMGICFVMLCSLKTGAAAGAATGTAVGIAMDAARGGVPFCAMAYAFSGLVSGVFGKYGRLAFVSAFTVANSLAVLCAWDYVPVMPALFEVFGASLVFMCLPPAVLSGAASLIKPMTSGMGESGLRRYASRRVSGIAGAYGDVCAVVKRSVSAGNDNEIARVFDRAADAACIKCKRRDECWTRDYAQTLDALNTATEAMRKRGRLETEDLPGWFRDRCQGLPVFTEAVNGELRSMVCRLQYKARLEEHRSAAWSQYEDFARILEGISLELGSVNGADPLAERRLLRYLRTRDIEADAAVFRDAGGRLRAVLESGRISTLEQDPSYLERLSAVVGVRLCRVNGAPEGRMTLLEAEPLAVSVGVAAMRKRGEAVSGDRGTYFKTDGGMMCVILSDGMGTGEEAARESGEAVEILERFLRCGVSPATAMKILNSVMLLRGGDDWGFATVDLMCVDLFTGEACFYKYGAAPSYVADGGTVKRVACESMAAGLRSGEGAEPDVVRMRLKPGSVAVIASDGVIPGGGDVWLKELMRKAGDMDAKTLARETLRRARQEYGAGDDMTVLAVRMGVRS